MVTSAQKKKRRKNKLSSFSNELLVSNVARGLCCHMWKGVFVCYYQSVAHSFGIEEDLGTGTEGLKKGG